MRIASVRRFALSVVIAIPLTIVLLFLMTRLILPDDHDPVVTRMIRNMELHHAVQPPDLVGIRDFKIPPIVEQEPRPTEMIPGAKVTKDAQNADRLFDESAKKEQRTRVIDWWVEVARVARASDEELLKRWLLEQGYESYVSIMQGPLPITNSTQAKLPPTQEDFTGYMNSYGDMEYKISENCVATTQVVARLDHSDFGKALPLRITCKRPQKRKFTIARRDRE